MRFLFVLLLVLGLLPAPAAAQVAPPVPVEAPPEGEQNIPIPGGHFFTEALPDGNGFGFAVQDGHGARLWTAFQALGGLDALGYPVSRRFEWDGRVAQAFERGVLRWEPATNSGRIMPLASLPGGRLPVYAIQPDQPPRALAELETTPWSGWWWPASEGIGPTLFAVNSPLDKYDRYVQMATGDNPNTRAWERREVYFPNATWAGHCNGFAAAALLEPEPTEPRDLFGITFTVGDLKGLLTSYHFADSAAWSHGSNGNVDPADLHRVLLDWLQVGGKGLVMTFDLGGDEVWSYPVYRFESEWGLHPDNASLWQVRTVVWMADMDVPPNFVGTKPYPGPDGKVFEYVLEGDPRNPSGGQWTGVSTGGRTSRPGRIWYPEPAARNLDRMLVSPGLDLGIVQSIIQPSTTAAPAR